MLNLIIRARYIDQLFSTNIKPRYAVPEDWYIKHKVRRYGFHGTSHKYVAKEASKVLEEPLENLNLVTAHLGHGCSIAAIKGVIFLD